MPWPLGPLGLWDIAEDKDLDPTFCLWLDNREQRTEQSE